LGETFWIGIIAPKTSIRLCLRQSLLHQKVHIHFELSARLELSQIAGELSIVGRQTVVAPHRISAGQRSVVGGFSSTMPSSLLSWFGHPSD
jgi:hypothetical protein